MLWMLFVQVCERYGLAKPVAYLLEKKGDTAKALDVMMKELRGTTSKYLESQRMILTSVEYDKILKDVADSLTLVKQFCQRVGSKMDQINREKTWLGVLDFLLSAIRESDMERDEKGKTGRSFWMVWIWRVLECLASSGRWRWCSTQTDSFLLVGESSGGRLPDRFALWMR